MYALRVCKCVLCLCGCVASFSCFPLIRHMKYYFARYTCRLAEIWYIFFIAENCRCFYVVPHSIQSSSLSLYCGGFWLKCLQMAFMESEFHVKRTKWRLWKEEMTWEYETAKIGLKMRKFNELVFFYTRKRKIINGHGRIVSYIHIPTLVVEQMQWVQELLVSIRKWCILPKNH